MIPQAAIVAQLERFRGWGYAPKDALGNRDCRYPTPIPGPVRTHRGPPEQSDCVCFVEGVVLGACHAEGILVDWPEARSALFRNASPVDRRWGPVVALVHAGLAEEVGIEQPPIGWAVCQGWKANFNGGHCFLTHTVIHAEVTVHECTKDNGFRGVRERAREWSAIRASYPHLRVARLIVTTETKEA